MKTIPSRSRGLLVAAVFLSALAGMALSLSAVSNAGQDHASGPADTAPACHVDEETAADNAVLKARLAQAEATAERAVQALEVLTRVNEAKDKQVAGLNDHVQAMTAALAELQGQNRDLQEAVIQQRSENRRLADQYRRVQEENKALQQRVAELEAKLKQAEARNPGGGENPPKPAPKPAPKEPKAKPINAKVVRVELVTDDLTLIQLSVGSDDGVQEGMSFILYRGDQFLGQGKVTTLDPGESVGKLTLGGGIKPGDSVRFDGPDE